MRRITLFMLVVGLTACGGSSSSNTTDGTSEDHDGSAGAPGGSGTDAQVEPAQDSSGGTGDSSGNDARDLDVSPGSNPEASDGGTSNDSGNGVSQDGAFPEDASPADDGGGQDSALPDAGSSKDTGAEEDSAVPPDSGPPPVCSGNQTRCNSTSNGYETCTNGQWGTTTTACVNQTCVNGACAGNCAPGQVGCDVTNNATWTCANGAQTDQTACTPLNKTCIGSSCSGECAPGQTNPVSCGDCGIDTQTCANGIWQSSGSCAGQGVCAANTTQPCNTYGTETCSPTCGGWGVCSCPLVPTCTPGAQQCSGTGVETCNSCGQWGSAVACPSAANAASTCSGAGVCGFTCDAGYGNCDGNPANGCETDVDTNSADCGTCGHSCCANGACSEGVCQPQEIVTGAYTFDIDNTYVYSYSSTNHTISKTPKTGGATNLLLSSGAYATGSYGSLFTNGVNVYWGAIYLSGTTSAGIYSIPVGGGSVTTINNDGVQKTALALDPNNLFWADVNGVSFPEVTWRSLTSTSSGDTLAPSSTAYVYGDMLSDGTNLYYTEQYQEPGNPDYPCSNGAQGSILRRIPVHGGTPMVGGIVEAACGTYSYFTNDSMNFYYFEDDYSTSSATSGTWSYPLAGNSGTAVQILPRQGGSMASDGTDLYICPFGGALYKMSVTGGTLQAITTTGVPDSCSGGPVRLDNTCVYFASEGSGVWTINKSP